MYGAKTERGSYRRYRVDLDEAKTDRLTLAAELRTALDSAQLVLHYQPQIDLASGRIAGVEVLTRWQHPQRGLLPPSEFVAVAEQSGLVRPFTLHVLDRAAAAGARWRRRGVDMPLSVNLSARNLLDRQLPDDVGAILSRHGMPASQLVLEITETSMMRELDVIDDVLVELRALGLELSVDDFGTGYSSLTVLQRVAVQEIKVDKSFVLGMLQSDSDLAIVRATVDLGHNLGLRVVAEGVENAEVLSALQEMHCDRVQGYHLGRPVPDEELQIRLGLAAAPA